MSKVEFELTAKEAQMVSGWKRGKASIESFNRELDKVGGKSASNKSKGDSFFKSVKSGAAGGARSLQGMITSLVGVGAVVGTVKSAYSEWRQEMQLTGDTATEFHKKLASELSSSGDLLQGNKVRFALEDINTATREQSLSAFGGVRGAAPTIDINRALELTRETSKAGKVLDETDLKSLGGIAGFIGENAPGKKAGDVLDMADAVRSDLGDRAAEANSQGFRRGVQLLQDEVGLSQEKALATMVTAIRSGRMRAATAGDTISRLSEDIATVDAPRTAEERQQNRLAKMSPAERFQAALTDDTSRKVLFGSNAGKLGQLTPELIEQETQRLKQAQSQDHFQRNIGAMERQFPVLAQERQADIDLDVSKRPIEARERGRNLRAKKLEAELNRDDRNAVSRWMLRTGNQVSEFVDDVMGNTQPGLRPQRPDDAFVPEEARAQKAAVDFANQQRLAGKGELEISRMFLEQNRLMQKQLEGQQAVEGLLRENLQRLPQVNVRVHAGGDSPNGRGAAALGVNGG